MKKVLLVLFVLFFSCESFAQNQNISNGDIFDGEPFIAVNPLNAQHMVVAWMGYFPFTKVYIKTKVTFDGGLTWSSLNSIPHTDPLYGSADPSLAFDRFGNVFLSFIDFKKNPDMGAVFVVKSTDGGLTWDNPVEVINANSDTQKPIDRPWISVDRSGGVNDGNIYITSLPPSVFGYLPPPYHPYFIASTDGGNTFNPWQYLDTINWLAGNFIHQPMATNCVSSNGTFYAIYPSYLLSQNPLAQFIVASSSDAGNSFSYHTVFSSETSLSDIFAKKGYLILSDPSDDSHLVFAYLDIPNGDIDIYIRESYDAGVTWENPVRINDDPVSGNRMQDLLWGDFDHDGGLVITWRDRRNGTNPSYETAYEIWGAYRNKDSIHFSSNFRISDTLIAYDTILAYAGNDFMCVKLVNDTLNAVWGDTRNGKLNIWFQRVSVKGKLIGVKQINDEETPFVNIYPNPTASTLYIDGKGIISVQLSNSSGQVVGEYGRVKMIDLSLLPMGAYFIRVSTTKGVVSRKILKIE